MQLIPDQALDQLIAAMASAARGEYPNDILELTREEHPLPVRLLAEACAFMMVKVEAREFRLQRLLEQTKENALAMVTAMAGALEARDAYSRHHAHRVGELAARLARRLGLSEEQVHWVRVGGFLHDVGKIGFSDAVFGSEDTRPNPELRAEIQAHPEQGADILGPLSFLAPAVEIVRCHHERLDGSGYPDGLMGEAIPLGARLVAVADTYDAITTDRPYQKGRAPAEAFGILREYAGSHYDPKVVEAFCAMMGEGE